MIKKLFEKIKNSYLYDPETKRELPSSPLWAIADIANTPDHKMLMKGQMPKGGLSKEYIDNNIKLGMMAGSMTSPASNVRYTGKQGTKLLFKPKKQMTEEDVMVLDQVLGNVNKLKDLSFPDGNFLRNVLGSVSKGKPESLAHLPANQLINEAVRHANLAEKYRR